MSLLNKRLIGSLTAAMALAGIYHFSDTETPQDSPKTPPTASTPPTTLQPPKLFALSGDVSKQEKLETTQSATQRIRIDPQYKLAHYWYNMFLNSTKPSERFDYLRWFVEDYGDISPTTFKKAADSVGLSSEALIRLVQKTATEFIKANATPPRDSGLAALRYWNELRLAYPYAGLTPDGNSDDRLARTIMRYDLAAIELQKDSYVLNAVAEIIPSLNPIFSIGKDESTRKEKREAFFNALENMPIQDVSDLRGKFDILKYALKYFPAEDLEKLGFSVDIQLDVIRMSNQATQIHLDKLNKNANALFPSDDALASPSPKP